MNFPYVIEKIPCFLGFLLIYEFLAISWTSSSFYDFMSLRLTIVRTRKNAMGLNNSDLAARRNCAAAEIIGDSFDKKICGRQEIYEAPHTIICGGGGGGD